MSFNLHLASGPIVKDTADYFSSVPLTFYTLIRPNKIWQHMKQYKMVGPKLGMFTSFVVYTAGNYFSFAMACFGRWPSHYMEVSLHKAYPILK